LSIVILLLTSYFLLLVTPALAEMPSSANFGIGSYSFGAGGAKDASSANFKLNGVAGEVEYGKQSSDNFKSGGGLTYLMKSNVPSSPAFSNPASNYDRLHFIINTSNNPSDTTFALQISTDSSFATNLYYVKSDNTIGTVLDITDFKTYTNWGGASGVYVTGLRQGTTYYIRAKARQANYTESEYGPTATASTSVSSLTYSLDSSSVVFSNLNSGNSYTDSTKSTVMTTTTNAYNGYTVYLSEDQSLSFGSFTIPNYASPNSDPTTWSGTGFGYSTSDASLTGGTANRFTGTKYAGFTSSHPGDPVADHTGPVQNPTISNEQFTVSYRVTGNGVTPAGTYNNTLIYTITPSY
jgi:hypothetical protein